MDPRIGPGGFIACVPLISSFASGYSRHGLSGGLSYHDTDTAIVWVVVPRPILVVLETR